MPSSLTTVKGWIKSIPNEKNRSLVHEFASFMETTDTSDNYRRGNLIPVIFFAKYLDSNSLSEVNEKCDIIRFLDTKKKDIAIDPDKRWIRTWNDYLQRIKYFMRWLHNGAASSVATSLVSISEWRTPEFVYQIKTKKTNRLSPYSESEIWDRDDLLRIIKYEAHKRNKAALALCWDLDARPHEVTLLKVKNLRLFSRYAEGEIPHESKTGTGPIMLTCSFPFVRDWLNEHPFKNEPNARVICNLITGGPVKADTLSSIMKALQKRIIRLIESGEVTDNEERTRLESLIKTRRWAPYCIRHSAISYDSDWMPEFALKKKVRWCMNSKQPSRYIKPRMGNELKQKILVHNGIISESEAAVVVSKTSPTICECARCQYVNSPHDKYCSSCGYPLSVAAYEEMKADDNKELDGLRAQIDKLTQDHSEVLRLKAQFDDLKRKIDRIDLVDLQNFPSDHTIRNLLTDYGIENKLQGPAEISLSKLKK